MTTIHSIVEPRKHVRVVAIGDGDVALDIGRPGRPAVSLAAIRVPVADLRAALNDFAPAGSCTRTAEEGDPRETVEFWQVAANVAKRRAEKAEKERDEARREREDLRASLKEANAALRASREQPVVPTGEMVGRLFRAAGEVVPGWVVSMNDCHHLLQVALTGPTRSKRAEAIEAILADKLGGAFVPHTIRALADRIDSEVQP